MKKRITELHLYLQKADLTTSAKIYCFLPYASQQLILPDQQATIISMLSAASLYAGPRHFKSLFAAAFDNTINSDNEIRIKHDKQQFVTGKSKLVKQGYLTRPSARSFRQTNLHLIISCYPFLIPAATCFCSLKLFSHRWRYIRKDPSHTLRKHLKYAHSHQEP